MSGDYNMEIKFNLENKWAKTFAIAARGGQQRDERSSGLPFGKFILVTFLSGPGSDPSVLAAQGNHPSISNSE